MVSIVGVGQTEAGDVLEGSAREIAFEAYSQALEDAKMLPKDLDALVVAGQGAETEGASAGLLAGYLGTLGKPAFNTEMACASATAAIHTGWMMIKSGLHNVVAVVGVEKAGSPDKHHVSGGVGPSDAMWEAPLGFGGHQVFAWYSSAYMKEYNVKEEDLGAITVTYRKHGSYNPISALKNPISLSEVMASPYTLAPIRKATNAPNTEAAACMILCADEIAHKFNDTPIRITGLGMGTQPRDIAGRNLLKSEAIASASQAAFKLAKITTDDIDIAAVHDQNPIKAIMILEGAGLVKYGTAAKLASDGQLTVGGEMPTNLEGGMQSIGHIPAASGLHEQIGIAQQLRGEARKEVQVGTAKVGVAIQTGGTGSYGSVTVLER